MMANVHLVSYATENFEAARQNLNASAKRFGISKIDAYSGKDLHNSDFYRRHRSILDETCGAGYWAWKPYFILQAMEHLSESDVLFYSDAGSLLIDSPSPLIEVCSKSRTGIVLFDARPLTNRQFTKRDCFITMGCDESKYWNANKVIATVLLVRKCYSAETFLQEWLDYCCDRRAVTDDRNTLATNNLKGFLVHRHDQSILSLLAAKYSLETFRNPSVWGNFLKLPEFRIPGELVPSPYGLVPTVKGYSDQPQENSPYGTLFAFNRQPNMVGKIPLVVPQEPNFQRAIKSARAWLRMRSRP